LAVSGIETPDKGEWTAEEVCSLSIPDVAELYSTLKAPSLEEMHGEYRGGYIGCGHLFSDSMWKLAAWNPLTGIWQGKSFEPISKTEGRGFNLAVRFGRPVRKWPMRTMIAGSLIDGKEAFQLDYPFYSSLAAFSKFTDEVRKIDDNLFLGIGHWKPLIYLASVWFTLSGPVKPFDAEGARFKKRVMYKT
jgi:hypothetical protein